MDGAIDAHAERIDERLARLRRAHRNSDGLEAESSLEIDRLRDRAQVIGADHIDAIAPDGAAHRIEVGILDQWNLLDTNCDLGQRASPRETKANQAEDLDANRVG